MQKMNMNWTAKTLVNQMKKGTVNFDNAVQRSLVWDATRKSLLIHSMVYGYAIPAMYFTAERGEDGKISLYDSLDGKQRSNAIAEYMGDEFALVADTPLVYNDDGTEENISDMTFSQLPEWVQDRIKDYNLTIYYYEDMTEAEVKEFFRRLNNGKPLSAVEITRVNTPSLTAFQEFANHTAIQSIVSATGKKRFTDENIAMQIYHLYTEDQPDFSTKSFREWAKSVETSKDVMDILKSGLDCMDYVLEQLTAKEEGNKKAFKAIKSRSHFVAATYFCALCVKDNLEIDKDDILDTLRTFFSGNPSASDDYNKTVGSGSAKPTAVQTRKKVMTDLYNNMERTIPQF